MHVDNRPRGELVEVLPAAVSPGYLVRTAADRGPRGEPVEVPGRNDRGTRLPTWNPAPAVAGMLATSRASTRMHVGNRPRGELVEVLPAAVSPGYLVRTAADRGPRGEPVEVPGRNDRGTRLPTWNPAPAVAGMLATSRASTRMHVGNRPRGGHVKGLPGPIVARMVRLSRALTRMHVGNRPRGGHVKGLPGSIVARVVRLSRASTRMHAGNRPRGELVEVLPAAVSPGYLVRTAADRGPRGEPVEVPGRNDRGTRLPTWNPVPAVAGMLATSRASTRMHVDSPAAW